MVNIILIIVSVIFLIKCLYSIWISYWIFMDGELYLFKRRILITFFEIAIFFSVYIFSEEITKAVMNPEVIWKSLSSIPWNSISPFTWLSFGFSLGYLLSIYQFTRNQHNFIQEKSEDKDDQS